MSFACPHCSSPDVAAHESNVRLYLCPGCLVPSILDTCNGVEGLRPVVRADMGTLIGGKEALIVFGWVQPFLKNKLTVRFGGRA